MQIGRFHHLGDSYTGRLQTLALDVLLRLMPIPRDNNRAPDWRAHLDDNNNGPQIDSGWTHERDSCVSFIAIQVDYPTFIRPLRANLVPARGDADAHILLWSRRPRSARES